MLVDLRHKPSEDDILMYKYLKYFNLPVTIVATKADKLSNNKLEKAKSTVMRVLDLQKGDSFIPLSNITAAISSGGTFHIIGAINADAGNNGIKLLCITCKVETKNNVDGLTLVYKNISSNNITTPFSWVFYPVSINNYVNNY